MRCMARPGYIYESLRDRGYWGQTPIWQNPKSTLRRIAPHPAGGPKARQIGALTPKTRALSSTDQGCFAGHHKKRPPCGGLFQFGENRLLLGGSVFGSVGTTLGSVSSGSCSSRSSRCGSGSSSVRSRGHRSGCGCNHGSGCRSSSFFLLAASSQSNSSHQRCQYESLIHLKVLERDSERKRNNFRKLS